MEQFFCQRENIYIYDLQKYCILQRNSFNSKILISMKLYKKFIKMYAEHNKLNNFFIERKFY